MVTTRASALANAATVTLGGEDIVLLPHRAAWWRAQSTLLLADLHLGKCEAMRAGGAPIPANVHAAQLERLRACITETGASRVLVLGDLLHVPAGLTDALVAQVSAWRDGIDAEIAVVPGNHDRALATVAPEWRMRVLEARHDEGPFTFTHEPETIANRYTFAGHIHPAITLRSAADRLKLPCFHLAPSVCTLPAFSTFTAGGAFDRVAGDRVFAMAEGRVFEV